MRTWREQGKEGDEDMEGALCYISVHLPESGVEGPGYRGDLDNPPTDLATIVSDLVESWFVQLILTVTFALQSE